MTIMIDSRGLAVLLVDAIVLGVLVLKPISRNYDDSDRGSGSIVLMDPPLRPSYARCGAYLLTSFVVSCVLVGLRSPNPVNAYHRLVTQLILSVVPDPNLVQGYARGLLPVFQTSVIAFGVAFAVTFRATLGRRLMILFNVALPGWFPRWSTPSSAFSSSRPASRSGLVRRSASCCSTPSPGWWSSG